MWGEQEPSGCPRSTGFSPIQPWFHAMQCKSVLDPGALLLKVLYASGRFTLFLPTCPFPQFWHCEACFTEPLLAWEKLQRRSVTCGLPSVRAACQAGCHIQDLLYCKSAGAEDCSFCPAWWLEWPFFEYTVSLNMSSSPVHHCAPKQLLKPLPKSSQTGRSLPSGEICPENGILSIPWKLIAY